MKILNWIKANKFPIAVTAFIAAALLCVYFFISGIRKDHSLDLVKQELKLREETRQQIIQVREGLLQILSTQQSQINKLNSIDSLISLQIANNQTKLQSISTKEYEKSRTKVINDFSDRDLYDYFGKLPDSDNDY